MEWARRCLLRENATPGSSCSGRWAAICCCTSVFSPTRICKLKDFGITCSSAFLKQLPSTTQWPKSSVHWSLDGGGCGYACWTAMVLDLLPYKIPQTPRKKLGFLRYITFAASFVYVAALFLMHAENMEKILFVSFLVGNILYYAVGIVLAFRCKDNRAFCKYLCPVTVFLKPMSYFSLLRVTCDKEKCISCGKCRQVCPMNVDMTDNSRKRLNGTECILCMECVKACPRKAL